MKLTEGQKQYMKDPGSKNASGYSPGEKPAGTLVITQRMDDWIFVELKKNLGKDGSGVWVDPEGYEHYGPFG